MSDNTEQSLRILMDRAEIEHLLTTYSRAIDRLDRELLLTVYHEGARDAHANFDGTAVEFADYALPYLEEMFVCTMHHITHYNIEVFGDHGASETYFYAYHRLEGGYDKVAKFFGAKYADQCRADGTLDHGHDFICGGRYIDLLARREGKWAIADREITVEWKHFRPTTHGDPGSDIEGIAASATRDRNDIAYRFVERARKLAGV